MASRHSRVECFLFALSERGRLFRGRTPVGHGGTIAPFAEWLYRTGRGDEEIDALLEKDLPSEDEWEVARTKAKAWSRPSLERCLIYARRRKELSVSLGMN